MKYVEVEIRQRVGRLPAKRRSTLFLLTMLIGLNVRAASAQTRLATGERFEVLHDFVFQLGSPRNALVPGAAGKMYGTTGTGGLYGRGSIFQMIPDGLGGFDTVTMYSFLSFDASSPDGLILAADGKLYGSTRGGVGTLFRITTAGTFETLYAFTSLADGSGPTGKLVQAPDQSFFGVTRGGGAHAFGTVFHFDGSTVTTIHDFTSSEGRPLSGLIRGADGLLYGCGRGGANVKGVVYRVDPISGAYTEVHSFNQSDGFLPSAALLQASDQRLYGTTFGGGANELGTVFGVDTTGANFTSLHSFNGADGSGPSIQLIEAADGTLYGMTSAGGASDKGVAFALGAGGYSLLHSFTGPDGSRPLGGLLESPAGTFYGTAAFEGPAGLGVVFRMDAAGTVTAVEDFALPHGEPGGPLGALVETADGSLFGGARFGGDRNLGGLYRISPSGSMTSIHVFGGPEGADPAAGLIQASDGLLYGVTNGGGANGLGTVFRSDLTGTVTTLHSFDGTDGAHPSARLLEAADGNFYGLTTGDYFDTPGSAFRIDASGAFTALHDFGQEVPESELVEGSDGFLYSTTAFGGSQSMGRVFRMATDGQVSTYYDFSAEPAYPYGGVVLGSDGSLYGVAIKTEGAQSTAFRLDADANFSSLHELSLSEGTIVLSNLLEASDGRFYGAAHQGGTNNFGTIFRVDVDGNFEVLHDFGGDDGALTGAGLIQGSDGALYGASSLGGQWGGGVVFKLSLVPIDSVIPSSGPASSLTPIEILGDNFQSGASVLVGGLAAGDLLVGGNTSITASTPALAPGSLNDVRVANSDGTFGVLRGAFLADFGDVPASDPFHDYIETLFRNGITGGCGAGGYCPAAAVRRDQMAVFLLKGKHGPDFVPPPCTGIFPDVACTPTPAFAADWIEQLSNEAVTGGCGGGDYCPANSVTRAQMAVFLLKAKHGSAYTPPACQGVFADVACTPAPAFAVDWIEQLYAEGVTGGCSANPLLYCPSSAVTRGQMAVFLVRTFGLP